MTQRKIARTSWQLVVVSSLFIGGCRHRDPIGGCPYEDVELSPEFMTPWETTLEQDMAQLVGPFEGTFRWHDGEDVITVPKAGQEFEAEAIVELDEATARMRWYESTEDAPACELDYLYMSAMVSFVRLDDGEVELTTPITISRTTESSRYLGELEALPVTDLAPDLVPLEEFQTEGIWIRMSWSADGTFLAEYDYLGTSSESPGTGHGVSTLVADFVMP